ncbi:MAG: hypothetical protein Fur0014_10330 [Rubrivivax sp.]
MNGLDAGNGTFVLSVAVVPEPGAMSLMLAGLLGIGAWGRRPPRR